MLSTGEEIRSPQRSSRSGPILAKMPCTIAPNGLALRCRARAGFSRRSRENPVAWALGHWMARDKNSCP